MHLLWNTWRWIWVFGIFRYLFCCSYAHNVAPKGKYIAFVSAEAETDNPEEELKPGIELLGPIDEIFYHSYDTYAPTNNPEEDNCFISAVREHHSSISSSSKLSFLHVSFLLIFFDVSWFVFTDLWCNNTLRGYTSGCPWDVHQDHWKGIN